MTTATRSMRLGRGVLPAEMTSFVGRRGELLEVRRLLGASRMVTLTGFGGVGKTRLAARVAAEVRRSFRDGVVIAIPRCVVCSIGSARRWGWIPLRLRRDSAPPL